MVGERQESQGLRNGLGPFRIAAIYAITAALWIAFSDRLVVSIGATPAAVTLYQTLKGLFFVVATAGLLYAMMRRSTMRLRRRELYYRALTEYALDVIAILDADGTIRFASAALGDALGYAPGELKGKAALSLLHTEDAPAVRALVEQGAAVADFTVTVELRVRHKDGSWRTMAGVGRNLLADPVVRGIVLNCRDVTERRRTEADRDRLAAVVEQAVESVVITDPHGTIIYVNPAFERITGYRRVEAVGANPRMLKSGRQDAGFYERMWRTLLAGEAWRGQLVNKRKDGTLYEAEAIVSQVRDAAGRVTQYVGVQRDVTHQRRLEEQLRQSQKLEAVGQLTGGIAHDFNNILAVVLTNAELVAAALPPECRELQADLEDIRAAARSGSAMIKKLLGFSRRAELRVEPTNLAALVTDLSGIMRRILPATIDIQVVSDSASPDALVDPGAVQQILLNLLTNARDAMPAGGTVHIRTGVRRIAREHPAAAGLAREGEFVCVTVRDTGIGMDAATKARIFEPFFTTKPVGQGTGLGMPMIHGLMQQHGGFVEVESEVGRGTSVSTCFPVAQEQATVACAAAERIPRGSETVLMVDDEEALRRSAKRALERLGYTVLVAADGVEALDTFRRHGEKIALIVADAVMPRLGGRELHETLRDEGARVKFLLASGYTRRDASAEHALEVGAPFLQKPWTIAELGRKVRDVLDKTPVATRETP